MRAKAPVCRKDLKKFDRKVQDVVLRLKDQGAQVKVLDGTHVMLRAPGRQTSLKVSASRPAKDTLYYIERQFEKAL